MGTKDNSNLDEIFRKKDKDNSNSDEIFRKEDKDKIVQGIAKMYYSLGHEKFHTAIKITMDAVAVKKEKSKYVNFEDLKEILEGAIKIADGIHGTKRV